MIEILASNHGVLIGGAVTTVVVSGLSIALGMGLGLALAFGLLSERAPLARCAASTAASGGARRSWCSC